MSDRSEVISLDLKVYPKTCLPSKTACGLITQHVQSEKVAVFCRPGAFAGKKNSSSLAAARGLSEPWQAFLVVSEKCKSYLKIPDSMMAMAGMFIHVFYIILYMIRK